MALAEAGGRLPCPGEGCAEQLLPGDLAAHLTGAAFEAYTAALRAGAEGRAKLSLRAEYEGRLAELSTQLAAAELGASDEQLLRHVHHVVEDILTEKCPRCGAAVLDFEGCFALTCHRCNAGLCGWCFADCGSDAHRHVRHCALNASRHAGDRIDRLYGSAELFRQVANTRRVAALTKYLGGLPGDAPSQRELRTRLKGRLAPFLRDLGIAEDALEAM